MAEGIEDEVNCDPIRKSREVIRVKGIVRVLVGITEIRVVIDHNHQAALVVPNTLALRHISILLPRDPAVGISEAGYLDDFVDVVKLMKDGVIPGNILNFSVRQDLS